MFAVPDVQLRRQAIGLAVFYKLLFYISKPILQPCS